MDPVLKSWQQGIRKELYYFAWRSSSYGARVPAAFNESGENRMKDWRIFASKLFESPKILDAPSFPLGASHYELASNLHISR